MNSSPYVVSNWVEGPNFYGREELCTTLTSSHDRCIYLVGMRRIGKTSLLKRLASLLSPLGLYCDLMQTASQRGEQSILDETRLVRLLQRELVRQVDTRYQATKQQHGDPPHPDQDDQRERLRASRSVWERASSGLVPWLEEVSWSWEELDLTATLLWDEAEMLGRLPPTTLMGLRAVLQNSRSLRVIVCASKGLAALNDYWREAGVSPFLFGFKTSYMSVLTDQASEELIYQRGQVQIAPETVERIRAITGNHPFLLQTLCDRLYTRGTLREPHARDVLVDPMMADLFRIDVSYLSPGEQSILQSLARHSRLNGEELQQHTSLAAEVLQSFTHGMLQLGYLRLHADGRWDVGNDFLAQWMRYYPVQALSTVTDQASLEIVDAARLSQMDNAHSTLEEPLSERELEVLRLLSVGRRNPEIARLLMISENTVKAHVKNIYRKLSVNDRVQAVNRARELRIL